MKYIVAALALLVCSVQGAEFDRPCRTDVPAKENFLSIVYTGTWFEIQRSAEDGWDCVIHHYTRRLLTDDFDVVRDGVLDAQFVQQTGTAYFAFPDDVPLLGIFNATLNRDDDEPLEYRYQVYATDYSNYSILWRCEELPNDRSREEVSILGRSTTLSPAVDEKITELVALVGHNREDFRMIDHSAEVCLLRSA